MYPRGLAKSRNTTISRLLKAFTLLNQVNHSISAELDPVLHGRTSLPLSNRLNLRFVFIDIMKRTVFLILVIFVAALSCGFITQLPIDAGDALFLDELYGDDQSNAQSDSPSGTGTDRDADSYESSVYTEKMTDQPW